MELVAYARGSDGDDPGHIVVGQEAGGAGQYYGYRFDPEDLPPEVDSPAAWRAYLFDHTVPGSIVEESAYVARLRRVGGFRQKRAACPADLAAALPPPDQWRRFARYSFNPDDFHSDADPCYNCVTWAVAVCGRVLAGFLVPVRQGRMKLILEQLT